MKYYSFLGVKFAMSDRSITLRLDLFFILRYSMEIGWGKTTFNGKHSMNLDICHYLDCLTMQEIKVILAESRAIREGDAANNKMQSISNAAKDYLIRWPDADCLDDEKIKEVMKVVREQNIK